MINKSKPNRKLKILAITAIAALIISSVLLIIPISTVRVGECGGIKPTRLSLIKGDLNKLEEAKNEAKERRAVKAEVLRKNPGLAIGCSYGPTYQLYLF